MSAAFLRQNQTLEERIKQQKKSGGRNPKKNSVKRIEKCVLPSP